MHLHSHYILIVIMMGAVSAFKHVLMPTPSLYRRRVAYCSSLKQAEAMLRIERHVERKYEEFDVKGRERCPKCWFYKPVCLCGKIAKLRQRVTSDLRTEVVIFMHHREFGKASNTGKLASLVSPSKCRTEIYGTKNGDAVLHQLCEAKDKQLVVLYPSQDSHQLSQYSRKTKGSVGNMIESQNTRNTVDSEKTLVLAVLDSTWSQANRMNKNFPDHIPRVHIDDQVDMESLYLCRKQNPKIDRFCLKDLTI